MTDQTTTFNEHCECCDAPAQVVYKGEEFQSIQCGCVIRIAIRANEHEHFVSKIRAARDASR
jgi:hypothetical protein